MKITTVYTEFIIESTKKMKRLSSLTMIKHRDTRR